MGFNRGGLEKNIQISKEINKHLQKFKFNFYIDVTSKCSQAKLLIFRSLIIV